MPLSYSNNLRLTLIGNGEQSGTWGDLTNINLGTLLEQAISGYTTVSMLDANYTLTTSSGATDEARSMGLNITSSVTLTATRNVIVPTTGSPPTSAPYTKLYVVKNATTGGQSIVIKTSAGSGITIANGATAIVLCDGTNVIDPFSSKQAALGYTPVNKAGDTMTGQLNLTGTNNTPYDTNNVSVAVRNLSSANNTYSGFSLNNASNSGALLFSEYTGTTASRFAIATNPGTSPTALASRFTVNSDGSFTFLDNTSTNVASIDASARLNLGGTSAGTVYGSVSARGYASRSGQAGSFSGNVYNIYWNGSAAELYIDNSSIGSINVTSDYRIKQNVVTQASNAVDRVNALRPVTYQIKDVGIFKADGVTREGFIAHELAEVIPSAVNGAKDALTEDGNIQPQSLRLDPIIAVLTKAVQELSARVAALEAK